VGLASTVKHETKPTKEKKSRDTNDTKKEEKTDRHMLVVSKWTIDNWMKAFNRIFSNLRVVKFLGHKKERVSFLKSLLFIH
jgi:hypothetical protein